MENKWIRLKNSYISFAKSILKIERYQTDIFKIKATLWGMLNV